MKAHLAYLNYVLRHKWFVFLACLKCHVPLWRAIIHDWHKFLPSEWSGYVHTFYNTDGSKKKYAESDAFKFAWNFHQKRGKHHWQYWLLTWDRGETVPIDMPTAFIYEMVADWWGAGRAITGNWDAPGWYSKNRDKINITPVTRVFVEELLHDTANKFETPTDIERRIRIIGS